MNGVEDWRAFYARLGFATIPLRPREKRPLRRGWLTAHDRQWDRLPRGANLGVLTGAPSAGLVVLDFDTGDGPFDVLGLRPRELSERTMVARTARGWHVYVRAPGAVTSSPRSGLDVRADGAMVVAPPSVHPSGTRYEFVGDRFVVAELSTLASIDVLAPVVRPIDVQVADVDMGQVEAWIAAQWPALQAAWAKLKRPPAGESYDPSRADFAVARCLWEGGYAAEQVASILCGLPGSRAQERGRAYALRTALRAQAARRPRPQQRH